SWPGSYSRRDAISVTFKAGYETIPAQGETPAQSSVPEPIKLAIILQVKLNYDPLEPAVRESYQRAIDALVGPFRRVGV
ncbi:MAG: phage gp6-like head-tail connector protein, partial [Nitrobacter sp.]|nr:phage gp6-like head-tail connector protein [Nitrobacter sp.]